MLKGFPMLGLCAAFMLTSCASKDSQFVGTWTGSVKLTAEQKKNPLVKQFVSSLVNMPLELNADHTFKTTMVTPIEGTWSASGNSVTLKPTTVGGEKISDHPANGDQNKSNSPLILTVSSDGKTMTVHDDNGKAGNELVFTKQN